jgi:uncharacterized membrane protein
VILFCGLNGLFFLQMHGFHISYVLACIGFLLFLLPGFIIVRLLKVEGFSGKNVLLAIGCSISFALIGGFIINFFGLIFHIKIFTFSVIGGFYFISILVLLLCCYIRERSLGEKNSRILTHLNINRSQLRYLFLFIALPILSILGTQIQNIFNNNIIILILIGYIIGIILLFIFNKIPKELFPVAIFSISLSLLLQTSLITDYIWGYDINVEKYFADLVLINSSWNLSYYHNVNSVLSVVVLGPILSILLNLDIIWIFKIIYPFFYSLVPVGLYYIYQEQAGKKIAFIGALFFIIPFTFYMEMPQLARQEIAELFIVLIILILFSFKADKWKKNLIILVFLFSLVVSHYGLSLLFLIIFCLSILFSTIWKIFRNKEKLRINSDSITIGLLFIFFVLYIAWYMYISNGSIFFTIVNIEEIITQTFVQDLFNPDSVQGLNVLINAPISIMREYTKYLHILGQICIFIGLFGIIIQKTYRNIKREYIVFSFATFCILVFALIIPNFSNQMNTSRIYHISLIVLSIFFGIGVWKIVNFLGERNGLVKSLIHQLFLVFIGLYLILMLLFNSGVMYELFNEQSSSIALDRNFDFPYFSKSEIFGAIWEDQFKIENSQIFADEHRRLLLYGYSMNVDPITNNNENPRGNKKTYFYSGTINIKNQQFLVLTWSNGRYNKIYVNDDVTRKKSKLYSNGGSTIFFETT